jgi:hypothetical protein
MATTTSQVSGQYYETCSCDFVCPCLPGQMAVRPTGQNNGQYAPFSWRSA